MKAALSKHRFAEAERSAKALRQLSDVAAEPQDPTRPPRMKHPPSPLLRPGDAVAERIMLGRMLRGALYVKAGFIAVLGLAAGLLYLRLSAGPLDFEGLADQVAKSLADRIGPGWSVSLNDTALQLEAGSPALRTAGLTVRDPEGVLVLRAPYAVVSLDAVSLMSGSLQPRLVELRDLHLRASINPDGSLSFIPAEEAAASQPPESGAVAEKRRARRPQTRGRPSRPPCRWRSRPCSISLSNAATSWERSIRRG